MDKTVNVFGEALVTPFLTLGWDNAITFAAATTCYQSEKYTKLTVKDFVEKFKTSTHKTPLEFSWYVIAIHSPIDLNCLYKYLFSLSKHIYIDVSDDAKSATISGNGRAFFEYIEKFHKTPLKVYDVNFVNFVNTLRSTLRQANPVLFEERSYVSSSWDMSLIATYNNLPDQHKWYAFRVNNVSIGFSREFNRHRTFSINERSTRYTGSGRAECISYVYNKESKEADTASDYLRRTYAQYTHIKKVGVPNDIVRQLLPLATVTEEVFAARLPDLYHFLDLREETDAHPEIREVARQIHLLIPERESLKQ